MKLHFLFATVIVAFAIAVPTRASTIAFVSPTGSGTTCSLAAPCVDMVAAITAAGSGGSVVCLARGSYSGFVFVSISQSVTISCGDGLWQGTGTALNINTPAGSHVVIEGFVSDGVSSVNGINFTGQGELDLLRVRVSNNAAATNGLSFKPSGNAELRISDSAFLNTAGSGISITPQSGTTKATIRNTTSNGNTLDGVFVAPAAARAVVALENVSASGNRNGLAAITKNTNMSVFNSTFNNNAKGVLTSGHVDLTLTTAAGNSVALQAATNGEITLARSRIYGNGTGLLSSGGQILSFGNNEVNGNTTDGAPTSGPLPLK